MQSVRKPVHLLVVLSVLLPALVYGFVMAPFVSPRSVPRLLFVSTLAWIRRLGLVASCRAVSARFVAMRQPTFLNLGKPYPDHVFTALVWGSNRPLFSYPPESLEGEHICVEGIISEYRGKPQIIVSRPSQITRAPEP